jgi:hypothetical protein
MNDPIQHIFRIRRIAWGTVVGILVWPVALLMAWAYPEERRHWLRVLGISLILTVIVLIGLGIKGLLNLGA